MSYEGYTQRWCKTGHLHKFDCSVGYYVDDVIHCPTCQAEWAWINSVDETNGESSGYIQPKIATEAVTQRCNLGCDHVMVPETYEIPNENTPRMFRSYHNGQDWWFDCKNPKKPLRPVKKG